MVSVTWQLNRSTSPVRAGWDCHGLPVELAVEKELGFSGKQDIEKYGVAEFNAKCRESVERHVDAFPDALHFGGLSFYRRDDGSMDGYIVMKNGDEVREHHLRYERR